MPGRAESLSIQPHPLRWILTSALGWAFLTELMATLRQFARKPSMARMSEQWLLSHEKEFSRLDY